MIIKIDHIGIVKSLSEKENILKENTIEFEERRLSNIDSKKAFMKNGCLYHDLCFCKDSIFCKEYIFYEKVDDGTPNNIENGVLYGAFSNKKAILEAVRNLSWIRITEEEENVLRGEIGGILDKRKLAFCLHQQNNPHIYLDSCGINNIAFLCSNRHYDKSGLFQQSRYEKLRVNGRELYISFLYTQYLSIIFELICLGEA